MKKEISWAKAFFILLYSLGLLVSFYLALVKHYRYSIED